MSKDLVERLRIKADMVLMCEKIKFGSDAAVMKEAAERIEQLETSLRAVMDDLTLIDESHWLPVGLLDDVIYVNALAALEASDEPV